MSEADSRWSLLALVIGDYPANRRKTPFEFSLDSKKVLLVQLTAEIFKGEDFGKGPNREYNYKPEEVANHSFRSLTRTNIVTFHSFNIPPAKPYISLHSLPNYHTSPSPQHSALHYQPSGTDTRTFHYSLHNIRDLASLLQLNKRQSIALQDIYTRGCKATRHENLGVFCSKNLANSCMSPVISGRCIGKYFHAANTMYWSDMASAYTTSDGKDCLMRKVAKHWLCNVMISQVVILAGYL